MCGRYTHLYTWRQLHRLMRLTTLPPEEVPLFSRRYNVAPTQAAPVVRQDAEGGRGVAMLRWGLVPRWADDPAIGNRMVNARAETAAERPAFRDALRRRRCLVPVSGFYEWRAAAAGSTRKQPFYIRPREGEVLALAGLWERCDKDPAAGPLETFTILTTAANGLMRPIHDRMPAILPPAAWDQWLDTGQNQDAAALAALLVPAPEDALVLHRVSTRVNSPRHDDPGCIEPLPPDPAEDEPESLWGR